MTKKHTAKTLSSIKYSVTLDLSREDHMLLQHALIMRAESAQELTDQGKERFQEELTKTLTLAKHIRDQFTLAFGRGKYAK